MDWKFVKDNTIVRFIKRKKAHFLFPIFTGSLGAWLGLLLTPTIGVIFIAISVYLAIVIFVPWNKSFRNNWKLCCKYFIPAVITLLIVVLAWDKLISIFPTTSPYKQPLRTGEANIEVTVEPNGLMSGGLRSFGGLGRVLLVKDGNNIILEMNGPAAREQIESDQVNFWVRPRLYLKANSINKPIYQITEAETAIIWFEKLPPKSKVVKGEVVFTFNSSIRVEIPIPSQTMKDDVIIIQDIQKYFEKGNWI